MNCKARARVCEGNHQDGREKRGNTDVLHVHPSAQAGPAEEDGLVRVGTDDVRAVYAEEGHLSLIHI